MSYKLTDHTVELNTVTLQRANLFLRMFADEVQREAEPRTPKKEGFLRRSVLKEVTGLRGRIKWVKAYAAIQEEKQHRTYTTPGTGPHYAKNAINSAVKNTVGIAQKAGLI